MSALFWLHVVVVFVGCVFSISNLRDAVKDLRILHDRNKHGVVEVVAQSWVVREVLHLSIQIVFVSFIVAMLLSEHLERFEFENVRLMEFRSVWTSGCVFLLSLWDWFIRKRLREAK